MPGVNICSCQASADHRSLAHSGKCLFEMKILQICVCACLMSKPFKTNYFLLHTYTYNPRSKAGCECQLCLKLRIHLCGIQIQISMRHCCIHVFQTPLSPSYLFFLGKPTWTLESAGWIPNFTIWS